MEWLILLLLVPAILVPIVLLCGFAGCDIVLGLTPPTFETAFEVSPTAVPTDQTVAPANYCFVQRISAGLVHDQVSPETRDTLRRQLTDPEITRATLDDRMTNPDIEKIAALVLGSPEFQRR